MNKHLLLIDEDPLILKSLKRSLRKLPSHWKLYYTDNADKALDLLATVPIDIMIGEVRLAGNNGHMLLEAARQIRPQAARIVLTGYTDPNAIFQYIGLAHQLLAKPWDDRVLLETIQRSYLIRGLLTNDHMKAVLNQIDSLPTIPEVYLELVEKLKSENTSLQEITDSVIKDPSLTIKILQIVNSPYYGLPMKVVDPSRAVGLLGVDFLKGIVLASGLFKKYNQSSMKFFSVDNLWEHSVYTSSIVKQIAKMEGVDRSVADTSAISALLHDVGKIILAVHFPEEGQTIQRLVEENKILWWQAELKVLGTTHAAVSAYLLGLWGMPVPLIQAVLCHHQPVYQPGGGIDSLVLLHTANALVNAQMAGNCLGMLGNLDYDFISRLKLSDHLARWQDKICNMV